MSAKGIMLMKFLKPYQGSGQQEFAAWLDEVGLCGQKPNQMTQDEFDEAHATAKHLKKMLDGELP